MATFDGNAGEVDFGANGVGEVRSWSIEETAETKDDTAMGDTARTHKSSFTSWRATVTCWWDDTDTAQEAATIGASVSFVGMQEGDSAGKYECSGTATVVSIGEAIDMGGLVERTFELLGSGALSRGTVSA